MKALIGALILLVLATAVKSASLAICSEMCFNGCPAGEECKSNGCGHQCYKIGTHTTCPSLPLCDILCFEGQKIDEKTKCAVCACNNSPVWT